MANVKTKRRSILAAVMIAITVSSASFADEAIVWGQPVKVVPKTYKTPVRNFLFGRKRFVPTGPVQPYKLVPGQIVFPREVPPTITYPQVQTPELSR